ncbi:hypothetical protein KR009_010634 [Drosophila setifemur]|nr:hypothetical protein KR009_010634 [Drosophila setifemur]
MAMNASTCDVENRLENFVIRKNDSESTDFTKTGAKIHDSIPLTFAHIQRATKDPDSDVYMISQKDNEPIYFRTCIAYAFVFDYGTHNKSFHKFQLDDSTGSLEASIANKPMKRHQITCLHKEVTALASSEGNKEIAGCLIRLLETAMECIDPSLIMKGNSLFLLGRPNLFRDKVGFDVFSFLIDSEDSQNLEMAFADHLLDWHNKNSSTQHS